MPPLRSEGITLPGAIQANQTELEADQPVDRRIVEAGEHAQR
jgi:hypothetical protein